MSGKKISDIELHAFIDGELEADQLPEIKAAIEADSALAERIEAFRADKEMLRRIYAPLAHRPIPREWVALARRPNIQVRTTMSWRMVGSIAAVMILTLAGTFAYWQMQAPNAGEIVQTALDARGSALLAASTIAVRQGANIHQYDAVLSTALALDVKAPDMTRLGYQLAEIRLYRGSRDGGAGIVLSRSYRPALYALFAPL
jgi:anti-sigma factor RsiW